MPDYIIKNSKNNPSFGSYDIMSDFTYNKLKKMGSSFGIKID